MKRLRLTFACWDYDRTRALADGRVQPDGIGVRVTDVEHLSGGEEEPGRDEKIKLDLPSTIRLRPIGPTQTLSRMIAEGELDALVAARAPSTFYKYPEKVRRLFDNYVELEKEYYRRTRINR